MSGFDIGTTRGRARPLPPATVEQVLDHEEALAIERIRSSVQRAGEELCAVIDLRPRIRRHPLLAAGLGAAFGFVGGPIAPGALGWIVRSASRVSHLAARMPGGAFGFVLSALRGFRARR
jgi:hypothetical protein